MTFKKEVVVMNRNIVVMITFAMTADNGGGPYQSHKRIVESKLNEKYNFVPLYVPRVRVLLSYSGMKQFVATIKKEKPDIVHFTGLQLDGFLIALACKFANVKRTVLAIRGSSNEALQFSNWKKMIVNFLEMRTLQMATVCYGVSEYVANWEIVKRYARNFRGHIYNMPHQECTNNGNYTFREEMGFDDNDVLITSTGRITIEKGFAVLIESIKKMTMPENVKFVIVGKGEYSETLKKEIEAFAIKDRVFPIGFRTDVGKILSESDIFVICTLHETLCNSIIEAGQQGLPSVATNVGGIPEIIKDGYNGYLVNAFDSTAVAESLKKLINDKQLRTKMGKNAKTVISEKFAPSIILAQIDEMYGEIMKNDT